MRWMLAILAIVVVAQANDRPTGAKAEQETNVDSVTVASELKLLGFFLGGDTSSLTVDGIRYERGVHRTNVVANAWVDIGGYTLRPYDKWQQEGALYFQLEANSGARFPVHAYPTRGESTESVAYLMFAPASGGDFVNPDLVALIDGEEIARWLLQAFPTDLRVIPADEPSVTEVKDVLGLTIKATSWKRVNDPPRGRFIGQIDFRIDVTGDFSSYREYWVYYGITESTWHKDTLSRMMGSLFTEPRLTGHGSAEEYAASAERLRVTGRVEKYDVYGEEAVFIGLEIVRDPITGSLYILNGTEQTVVLSSGVKIVMREFAELIYAVQNPRRGQRVILSFPIEFPDGVRELSLPLAKDKLSVTDDVYLWIGRYVANEMWIGAGGRHILEKRRLLLQVDPRTVWTGGTFDISIEVKHSVKVAIEPIQFLVPVGDKPPTPSAETP